jgi:gamma-glutamyltranspeptidase
MRILWFGEGIKQAVDASRLHHQIFPMEVAYDYGILDVCTPLVQGRFNGNVAKYKVVQI